MTQYLYGFLTGIAIIVVSQALIVFLAYKDWDEGEPRKRNMEDYGERDSYLKSLKEK